MNKTTFKECQVVILSTKKVAKGHVQPYGHIANHGNDPINEHVLAQPWVASYLHDHLIDHSHLVRLFHLYIVSGDSFSVGDVVYNGSCIHRITADDDSNVYNTCQKVIASTDDTLNIAMLSEGFIEKYSKTVSITKVAIEYGEHGPVVNSNGGIAVRSSAHLLRMKAGNLYVIEDGESPYVQNGELAECIGVISHDHNHYNVQTFSCEQTNITAKFRKASIVDVNKAIVTRLMEYADTNALFSDKEQRSTFCDYINNTFGFVREEFMEEVMAEYDKGGITINN